MEIRVLRYFLTVAKEGSAGPEKIVTGDYLQHYHCLAAEYSVFAGGAEVYGRDTGK